jgi:MbtH protein
MTTSAAFCVVRNDEDQYSVWTAEREVPAGWTPEGFVGTREACLEHIDAVWTDMRPRSVREFARSAGR